MAFVLKLTKFLSKDLTSILPRTLSTLTPKTTTNALPVLVNYTSINNPWIWQKQTPINSPLRNIKPITIRDDLLWVPPISEPEVSNDRIIEDPTTINNSDKQAARLIVIRRKKMKKHKLKKLRKKMKYLWAKRRQRRELRKEKEFQAGLIAQCKEAEGFSAEEYVKNKLQQATAQPPLTFIETAEYKELMRIKKLRLYQYKDFKSDILKDGYPLYK